jgi:hypothetical protein
MGSPLDGRDVWVMAYRQVIKPLGDYKSMHQFFLDLGVAAGYGNDFWQGDINAYINYQLAPLGITLRNSRNTRPEKSLHHSQGSMKSMKRFLRGKARAVR